MTSSEKLIDLMEEQRDKLKLRAEDMAKVLGVSRITYYKWRKSGIVRLTTLAGVEATLRKITRIMRDHNWPTGPEMSIAPEQRTERLILLLDLYK